jgi:hypothetical protein
MRLNAMAVSPQRRKNGLSVVVVGLGSVLRRRDWIIVTSVTLSGTIAVKCIGAWRVSVRNVARTSDRTWYE